MNATAEVDIWGIVSGFAGSRLPASGCRYSLGFPPGALTRTSRASAEAGQVRGAVGAHLRATSVNEDPHRAAVEVDRPGIAIAGAQVFEDERHFGLVFGASLHQH